MKKARDHEGIHGSDRNIMESEARGKEEKRPPSSPDELPSVDSLSK